MSQAPELYSQILEALVDADKQEALPPREERLAILRKYVTADPEELKQGFDVPLDTT